jgi:hypothetical protein
MFLRTIGQSVGTAIFGAMFNLGIGSRVSGAEEEINRLLEPATRASVEPSEALRLSDAIAAAIYNVYLVAGLLSLALFALAFLIPAGLSPIRQPAPLEARRPAASD